MRYKALYRYRSPIIMLVLCFDTETTGLPEGRHISIYETAKWPHIVQLSFMVYDTEKREVVQEYDEIIRI